MRWLLDNVITLCYYHHITCWHLNPTMAIKWYEKTIPEKWRNKIELRSQTQDRTPQDFGLIRIYLLTELKKYNPNFVERELKPVKHRKRKVKQKKVLSITAQEYREKQKELTKKANQARYQYFKNLRKSKKGL